MEKAHPRLVEISIKLVSKFGHSICTPCGGRCCKGCSSARGYFDSPLAFKTAQEKYGFDAGTFAKPGLGFLGEYGCKIPREERSNVCLSFWCGPIYSRMSQVEKDLVYEGKVIQYKHIRILDKTKG